MPFLFSNSVCVVGTRIVKSVENCTKTFDSDLYHMFCTVDQARLDNLTAAAGAKVTGDETTTTIAPPAYTEEDYKCDEYYTKHEAKIVQGIKGLSSGIFYENVKNKYHDSGDALSSDEENEPEYNLGGQPRMGYITSDIYTTFTLLVGIFFPSCTGENSLE